MKKLIAAFLAAAVITTCMGVYAETETNAYEAKAVFLSEASTGQVLYAQNENERLPIASVTKIMTLLLTAEALESGTLTIDTVIPASEHASSMDGSVIWLNAGEEMTAYDLIRSVVIASANDACVALAEYVGGGSEEKFVALMNKKAKALGMENTNFVDCTGLTDDENHYSTAADVAKMAAALRKYTYFDEFLLTRLTYVREGTERETQLLNTNKLINKYEGLTGLKTGTTDSAGYCFVATAKRSGMELVAVVLGAKDEDVRFDIAKKLLDWGFGGYELFCPSYDGNELLPISVKHGIAKSVALEPAKEMSCLVPKGKSGEVTYLYDLPESIDAPVEKGERVGKIIVLLGDETLFLCDVNASESVEELTFFKSLEYLLKGLFCF